MWDVRRLAALVALVLALAPRGARADAIDTVEQQMRRYPIVNGQCASPPCCSDDPAQGAAYIGKGLRVPGGTKTVHVELDPSGTSPASVDTKCTEVGNTNTQRADLLGTSTASVAVPDDTFSFTDPCGSLSFCITTACTGSCKVRVSVFSEQGF